MKWRATVQKAWCQLQASICSSKHECLHACENTYTLAHTAPIHKCEEEIKRLGVNLHGRMAAIHVQGTDFDSQHDKQVRIIKHVLAFLVTVIKYLTRSDLREEELVLAQS